jgi:hypothetical protein
LNIYKIQSAGPNVKDFALFMPGWIATLLLRLEGVWYEGIHTKVLVDTAGFDHPAQPILQPIQTDRA